MTFLMDKIDMCSFPKNGEVCELVTDEDIKWFSEEREVKMEIPKEKRFDIPYYRKLTMHFINADFKNSR